MERLVDIALTSDIVLFNGPAASRKLLLIRRRNPPYQGAWALPGGFLEMGEDLVECAARELREETGIDGVPLQQIGAFGKPDRDPRGRVVSIAFWALLPASRLTEVQAADDAAETAWFLLSALPPLAFDHGDVVAAAIRVSSSNGLR